MHSLTFPGTFYINFLIYFCVGTLQMQYSFPLSEKIKSLIYSFGLVCRVTEAVALFLVLFPSRNLTYICVGTLRNIYFNIKDSGHADKFVVLVSLQIQ